MREVKRSNRLFSTDFFLQNFYLFGLCYVMLQIRVQIADETELAIFFSVA